MNSESGTSLLPTSITPTLSSSAHAASMEQLRSLKAIYDAAFITRKEYEERKKQLIDKLTNTTAGLHEVNSLPSSVIPLRDDQVNLVEESLMPFDVEEHLGDKAPFDILPPVNNLSLSDGQRGDSILTKEEKHDLAATISKLAPEHLDKIIQLIDLMAPHLLKFSPQGNEYSFDLNEFDDKMLSMVNEYVQTIQSTRGLPKDDIVQQPAVQMPYVPAPAIVPLVPDDSLANPHKRKAEDVQQFPFQMGPNQQDPNAGFRQTKRPSRRKVMTDFYTGTPDTSATEDEYTPDSRPIAENNYDVLDDDSSSNDESEDEDYREGRTFDARSRAGKNINRGNLLGQEQQQPQPMMQHPPITATRPRMIHEIRKSDECPNEKPWKCDFSGCAKCFSDSSNLLKHIRTHTKEKPYACPYKDCGKSYAHSASLKEHLNTHTGEKPFVCTYTGCTARFAQNSNLRRHTRIHTNEKPYVCSECGKAFTQSSNLKQHLTIHNRKRAQAGRAQQEA